MAKSDSTTVNRRIERCLQWIIEGWSHYRIAQYIAANSNLRESGDDRYNSELDWKVQERQVYMYCERAQTTFEEMQKPKRSAEWNKAYQRYTEILRRALADKDYSNARLAQSQIDKLTGVQEFGGGPPTAATQSIIKLPGGVEVSI